MIILVALVSQMWPPEWWPMYGGVDYLNTHFSPLIGRMLTTPGHREHWLGQPADSGGVETAPMAVNLDADPQLEIVAPVQIGVLDAWDPVSDQLQWRTHLDAHFFRTTGTMADVDGDGTKEIIMVGDTFWGYAMYPAGTYCLNSQTGASEWVFRQAFGTTSAKIMDLDGNGTLEIIVGSKDGTVYCLNGSGGTVWSRSVGGMADVPVAISDIDGDGRVEIVGATSTTLYALNHDGTVLWTSTASPGRSAPTIIPDVSGDGHPDVVHHATAGGVYCHSGLTGAVIWTNSSVGTPGDDASYGVCWAGTAAADLNHDGTWEVVTTQIASPMLWSLNARTGAANWSISIPTTYGVHVAVSLFDVDGDNDIEIAVGGCCNKPETLRVYNPNGTILWKKTFDYAHDIHDPANADIDGDGCAELIVGTYDVSSNHNSVFVLDDGYATNCGILGQWEEHDPFPEARIRFSGGALEVILPRDGWTKLSIYDATGRLVRNLADAPMSSGTYTFNLPEDLAGGVYNAVLIEPGGSRSARIVIR